MNKQGRIALVGALFLIGILLIGLAVAKPPDKKVRAAKECNDGIDNDGDGDIDLADAGCRNPGDNDETNCGDGVCEGGETSESCPADCLPPDSCDDTDGGNAITVFGTASGYYNGSPYSDDDYCVDSGNIMEYYCSGDYEQSEQQSCGTDGYGSNYCLGGDVYRDYKDYFCLGGACDYNLTPELVEECDYGCTAGACDDPIPDSCNDTDGGVVLDIQGTVYGYLNEQYYNWTDYCAPNGSLVEFYCLDPYWDILATPCFNMTTCSNGACV